MLQQQSLPCLPLFESLGLQHKIGSGFTPKAPAPRWVWGLPCTVKLSWQCWVCQGGHRGGIHSRMTRQGEEVRHGSSGKEAAGPEKTDVTCGRTFSCHQTADGWSCWPGRTPGSGCSDSSLVVEGLLYLRVLPYGSVLASAAAAFLPAMPMPKGKDPVSFPSQGQAAPPTSLSLKRHGSTAGPGGFSEH